MDVSYFRMIITGFDVPKYALLKKIISVYLALYVMDIREP